MINKGMGFKMNCLLQRILGLGLVGALCFSVIGSTSAQDFQFSIVKAKYGSESIVTETVPVTETVRQAYTVQVPYTELVTQNYTVQVPYTEQVAETYTVKVPVTELSLIHI